MNTTEVFKIQEIKDEIGRLHIFRCHEPQVFVDLAVHRLKTFSLDIDPDIVSTHTLS